MATSITPQQPELLTSWKEIASYLGKGVRTVQRWEQQYGLPVRRPNEKVKGIVHATRPELDQWLREQWSQRPKEFAQVSALDTNCLAMIRAQIEQSAALRMANSLLLKELRHGVSSMYAECQAMHRKMAELPPLVP
jgi:hypothetical protein